MSVSITSWERSTDRNVLDIWLSTVNSSAALSLINSDLTTNEANKIVFNINVSV